MNVDFEPVDLLGFLSGMFWAGVAIILRRYPQADFRNTTCAQYVMGVVVMTLAIWMFDVSTPSMTHLPWPLR